MQDEPSLASLQRSVRFQGRMNVGLVIMILLAVVGVLREVYRVEQKFDAMTEQMNELRYWAGNMTAQVKKTTIEVKVATDAVEKFKEFVAEQK